MATKEGIRSKLQTKIFNKFGTSATREALSTETTDKWGDATTTYSAGASITIVPFDYITSRLLYQPFGDLQENEVSVVVEWDTTIAESDKITYGGTAYKVVEIEEYIFEETVAKAVRLVKMR